MFNREEMENYGFDLSNTSGKIECIKYILKKGRECKVSYQSDVEAMQEDANSLMGCAIREAYQIALTLDVELMESLLCFKTIKAEAKPAAELSQCVNAAILFCQKNSCEMTLVFNEINLKVNGKSSPLEISNKYQRRMTLRATKDQRSKQ